MKQPSKMWLPLRVALLVDSECGCWVQATYTTESLPHALLHTTSHVHTPCLLHTCLPCGMTQSICLQVKAAGILEKGSQRVLGARSASSLWLHCRPVGSLYVCMVTCVPWGVMKEGSALLTKRLASQLGISASDFTFFQSRNEPFMWMATH